MADAIGPEFVHQRTNEKEELKGLNNRFARYLKRVQAHCLSCMHPYISGLSHVTYK